MAGGGRLGNAHVFLREPGALRPVSLRCCASASRRVGPGQHHARPPHVAAENGVIDRAAKWLGGVALVGGVRHLRALGESPNRACGLRSRSLRSFRTTSTSTPDDEQSAFVTRVTPGLSFRGDTSRFTRRLRRGHLDPIRHRRPGQRFSGERWPHRRRRSAAGARPSVARSSGFNQPAGAQQRAGADRGQPGHGAGVSGQPRAA